jgi:hypothetical protein
MKSKNLTSGLRAGVCAIGVCIGPGAAAAAESRDVGRYCEVHAAAMVAEMQAQSDSPLQPEERALVRRTALKSCLAQNSPARPVNEGVEEAPRRTEVSAPSNKAKATGDVGFWGALDPILKGSTERSKGHERLRRRGRY